MPQCSLAGLKANACVRPSVTGPSGDLQSVLLDGPATNTALRRQELQEWDSPNEAGLLLLPSSKHTMFHHMLTALDLMPCMQSHIVRKAD